MMVSSIATKERQVQLDLLLSKNPHYQLSPEELVRRTLQSGEGELSDTGALIVNTGAFTGRSEIYFVGAWVTHRVLQERTWFDRMKNFGLPFFA